MAFDYLCSFWFTFTWAGYPNKQRRKQNPGGQDTLFSRRSLPLPMHVRKHCMPHDWWSRRAHSVGRPGSLTWMDGCWREPSDWWWW
ncbi:hypothetical protein B0T13DRAFT_89373 [Neurospora crassa]|nr:hypothetical protein B0T13DRAFT_89373 [Neurospora crassa]